MQSADQVAADFFAEDVLQPVARNRLVVSEFDYRLSFDVTMSAADLVSKIRMTTVGEKSLATANRKDIGLVTERRDTTGPAGADPGVPEFASVTLSGLIDIWRAEDCCVVLAGCGDLDLLPLESAFIG